MQIQRYVDDKAELIELYRQRANENRCIWTGRKLTDDDYKFAAQCNVCRKWFWSMDDKSSYQFCKQKCFRRWTTSIKNPYRSTAHKRRQILKALNELGEPSSPNMIAVVIAGYGETWPINLGKECASCNLNHTLKNMLLAGLLVDKGENNRRKYAIL